MTLATKCPACATVFRVVQDQLRVSEGWVRCGRCAEVFNAVAAMVEVPTPVRDEGPDTEVQYDAHHHGGYDEPALDAPAHVAPHDELGWAVERRFELAIDAPTDAPINALQEPSLSALASVPLETADDASHLASHVEPPEPAFDARPGHLYEPMLDASAAPLHGEPPISIDNAEPRGHDPAAATSPATDAPLAAPSFMQAAERAQRWQQPGRRRALALAGALAALVLVLQVGFEYRDLIAARWPATRAPLQSLCTWAGCRIDAPRLIDALVVDASGLTRIEGTQTYRLAVSVRNRSALELAMPALDLVLTDSQGRVISRRVLSPLELGTTRATVPAGAEFALQATLAVAERLVAGYTIDVFYP